MGWMRVSYGATVDLSLLIIFFWSNEKAEREVGHRLLLDTICEDGKNVYAFIYLVGAHALHRQINPNQEVYILNALCLGHASQRVNPIRWRHIARGGGSLAYTSTISLAISIWKSNLGDTWEDSLSMESERTLGRHTLVFDIFSSFYTGGRRIWRCR